MDNKTIDVYFIFKWSEQYKENFSAKNKVLLDHPEMIAIERKEIELKQQLLRMIMNNFFSRNIDLLRFDNKSNIPRLEWGFMVDEDESIRATIDANPREEWNDEVINQAKLFLEGLIKENRNVVKKSIQISSNFNLEQYPKLSEYLELSEKDSIRFHYTLNYNYLSTNNLLIPHLL